jgi:8-oxo-dGTP pyrophosphatase MutT (NUDIX family)
MAAPRILNPQSLPVVGTDAHLPAIDPSRLTPDALRRRLPAAANWVPHLAGDGRLLGKRPAAAAAVLVALVPRADGVYVLLTQRTEHLRDHAGQISFPGGRTESHDAGATGTALREAEEEIGLLPSRVEVIGQLPTYTTVSHFVVTPVVGLVQPPFDLVLDSFEVAEAFEVPLLHLMTPAHHQRHVFTFDGGQRHFLSMPWRGTGREGQPRDYFIWGATAAMLRNLYHLLGE